MHREPGIDRFEGEDRQVMSVDEIVSRIPDRNGRFKDPRERQRFTDVMARIVNLADREADAQGVPTYTQDQRIVLVFGCYGIFDKFFGKKRKNGEDIWEAHLMGTVEVLIGMAGIRGVQKVLTMGNHDTVEDLADGTRFEGESDQAYHRRIARQRTALYNSLVDLSDCRELLTNYDPEVVEAFISGIQVGVKGLTKVKKITQGKDLSEDDAAFGALLRALRKSPVVGVYKPCDIIVNGYTYEVHSPASRGRKLEVAKRYLTVAERFGQVVIAREMIHQRVHYLNPGLGEDFNGLCNDRLQSRLYPFEGSILGKFSGADGELVQPVVSVDFAPLDLYDATTEFRGKKDVAKADIGDLPIDFMHPMFEVVVLTRCQVDNPTDDQRRAAMMDAIAYIRWAFASNTLRRFKDVMPAPGSAFEYRGATIDMFDKVLGGQLRFRVNDAQREARSKRGVLAPYDDPEVAFGDIQRDLRLILDPNYRVMVLGTDDLPEAFEARMSPPKLGVYTPDGDISFFQEGANVLDFAASVSPAVFAGLQGAGVKANLESREPFVPVSPVAPLKSGKVYHVHTCLEEREVYNPAVQAGPEWYPFCGSMAAGYLNRALARRDIKDPEVREKAVMKCGVDYLARLSKIYKLDVQEFIDAIRKNAGRSVEQYPDDEIYKDITSGKCDPVLAVATVFDESPAGVWEFCIELPDTAGTSAKFFEEFSEEVDINIDSYKVLKDMKGKPYLYCTFDLLKADVSVRRFFYQMLRLNLKYKDKVELTRNPHLPLGVQDLYV